MCETGNPSRIDLCIRTLMKNLKTLGIKTLACCCGHGKYPMTIVVDHCGIYDIVSGKYLKNSKHFYTRDKKGIFYIPETVEGYSCKK